MFDSAVLGLVIGLILVYFLLSLVCSGVHEVVEAGLRRRAKFLEAGIVDLLGAEVKERLYRQPLVEALYPQKGKPSTERTPALENRNKPSYIPPDTFSQALMSILTLPSARLTADVSEYQTTLPLESTIGFIPGQTVQAGSESMVISEVGHSGIAVRRGGEGASTRHTRGVLVSRSVASPPSVDVVVSDLQQTLERLPTGRLRQTLTEYLASGGATLETWRDGVEKWFDAKMDRVSGWYARRTRWWLLGYAVVLVAALNADSIQFARTLWQDETLRDAVVAEAQSVADASPIDACGDPACVVNRIENVQELDLPLGWRGNLVPTSGFEWALKLVGLALTAAALTMGSPFWFDLLNKVTNLRSTGPPPKSDPSTEGLKRRA